MRASGPVENGHRVRMVGSAVLTPRRDGQRDPDRFQYAAQLLREAKAYREAPRHWRGETILRDAVAEQFRGPWGGVRM